jgi:GNAT superfamily N-acetyltransferase
VAKYNPLISFMLEELLEEFPKEIALKDGSKCSVRPLERSDEEAFYQFVLAIPDSEKLFIKHRVTDREVIRDWCQNIDYGRNLALLAFSGDRIIADATLHQQLGGWRRHIGRVSVLVHPEFRGRGLAKAMIGELIEIASQAGLCKVEAEFIGEQTLAMRVFDFLGFSPLVRLPSYVRDMQALDHDYILMGLDLKTDEEYAGMG